MSDAALPQLAAMSAVEKLSTASALGAAGTLVLVHAVQLAAAGLELWYVLLVPLSWIAADLLSGLVHWTADTWGSEDTPIIGRRFIRPFRVHHANAEDILARSFLRLNGDVALGVLPLLMAAFFATGGWKFFVVALALSVLPTNQIHQWAHQPSAPRYARVLQRLGFILSPAQHRLHHTSPHRSHFCITTGWCNGFLEKVQILKRVEQLVRRRERS